MIAIRSTSPEQTRAIGEKLGEILSPGDAIGLVGDLGTGKTVLIQGIARGLGVSPEQYVTSPTFIIVNSLKGRHVLHHVDLYRVATADDLESVGLRDILTGDAVVVIEWADRLEPGLVQSFLLIRLNHAGATTRDISFEQFTARLSEARLAEALAEFVAGRSY